MTIRHRLIHENALTDLVETPVGRQYSHDEVSLGDERHRHEPEKDDAGHRESMRTPEFDSLRFYYIITNNG